MPISKTILPALILSLSAAAFAEEFTLSSNSLPPQGTLPAAHVLNGFGCTGQNLSPALAWKNIPAGTRSIAVTMYDPDAPTGSGWWHWVVVNIPGTTQALAQGAGKPQTKLLPTGARQVRTDFGEPGYGGACPPAGDKPHRYIFTVHALKAESLDLPDNATAALAGFMINANTIGKASLTVHYGR